MRAHELTQPHLRTHTHISAAHICTHMHAHTHAHTATQSDTLTPFLAQHVHTINVDITPFYKKDMQFPISITQCTPLISSVPFAQLAVFYLCCQTLEMGSF